MKEPYYTSLAELQARPLPPGFETVTGPLPHNLLNDLMFRIVFEVNQEALKALLCSLLHYNENEIVSLEIKNPIQLGEHVDDKKCIFDIYVMLNNQKQIHLELQVINQSFWTNRSLYYLCKGFNNLNSGENYNKIQPLIQIDILDFDLFEGCEEFFSTYHLANDKTGHIFSDNLTLHVLQLNKEEYATEEDKSYGIDYWAKLFKATTWEELKALAMEHNSLHSTVETVYRVNADDYVRAELEAREDQLRIQRTYDDEINGLHATISEQQTTIDNQQTTIDNQQNQLAEKDAEIAELKAKLQQLNN